MLHHTKFIEDRPNRFLSYGDLTVFSERKLTFTFAIMLSPVRLSSVCPSSVRNIRAPYSAG